MSRLTSAVFVGRSLELARLEDALGRAVAGEGAGIVVGGEAGVGKTRLVEELAARAEEAGHLVLTGGCVEVEGEGLPLGPVVEALRGLARRVGLDGLARLAGGRRAELARLLPELGPAEAGPETRGPGLGRLLDLVLGLIEALAAQQPVLVVLEDLHWADQSTRSLAAFLLRNLRGSRVTLALTFRSEEVGPGHPLRAFLAEAERLRWVERLEVGRFGRAEVAALVSALFEGPEEPDDELIDTVLERSGGNAFFVEELVATARETGCIDSISPTLWEALLVRIDGLPPETRDLLRVAAAGGHRVEHALLAAVSGRDDQEVWAAARAAVAAGVLLVDPEGTAYTFRHALTRDALRHEALPGELAHLHRRYAEALARDPGLVGGGARATSAVAFHWYAAGDHVQALPTLLAAADTAACGYAYAEALGRYECALASWDQVDAPQALTGVDRLSVLEAAASTAMTAGELRRGLRLAQMARDEAARSGDPVRLALVLAELSKLLRILGDSDGIAEAREAVSLVPAEPATPQRATVLVALGKALSNVPRLDEALPLLREALSVAERTGAELARAAALLSGGCVGLHLVGPDDVATARQIATAVGDDEMLIASYSHGSDEHLASYRLDEAITLGLEGLRLARRHGAERSHGLILAGNVIEAMLYAGRIDDAERLLAEVSLIGPTGTHSAFVAQLRADLALLRGRLDDAARAVGYARRLLAERFLGFQYTTPLARLEAEIAMRRGDAAAVPGRIVAEVERFELDQVVRYTAPLLATGMSAAARAVAEARAAGDDAGVRRARDGADALAALAARTPFEATVTGEAYRSMINGLHARAWGREDPDAWAMAAKLWAGLGSPYPRGRALAGQAEALLAVGDRADAADALRGAAEIADALGAHLLRGELAELAARGGLALPATGTPGPARAGGAAADGPAAGLTARELEVLRLLADGASNPRIAAELFISRKTASTHVSNILGKLGVATRGEAAALAHRLRLFDAD